MAHPDFSYFVLCALALALNLALVLNAGVGACTLDEITPGRGLVFSVVKVVS